MLIGYARVSTDDQNLDSQIDALRQAGCTKIYTDKISGVKQKPELDKCLEKLQKGDTLVVYKLDRLSRTTVEILTLIEDLTARGISFKSVTESLDTTTDLGKLVLGIMASFAEFERARIKERQKAGIEAAKKRGVYKGGTPKLNPTQIAKIAEMRNDDCSWKEISLLVGVSERTCQRAYNKASATAEI